MNDLKLLILNRDKEGLMEYIQNTPYSVMLLDLNEDYSNTMIQKFMSDIISITGIEVSNHLGLLEGEIVEGKKFYPSSRSIEVPNRLTSYLTLDPDIKIVGDHIEFNSSVEEFYKTQFNNLIMNGIFSSIYYSTNKVANSVNMTKEELEYFHPLKYIPLGGFPLLGYMYSEVELLSRLEEDRNSSIYNFTRDTDGLMRINSGRLINLLLTYGVIANAKRRGDYLSMILVKYRGDEYLIYPRSKLVKSETLLNIY